MGFKLAAQMYTVRAFTNNADEVDSAFKKIGEIGYKAVQVSGFKHFDAEQILKSASKYGIEILSLDASIEDLTKNTAKVIDWCRLLGAEYVCLGYFPLKSIKDCDTLLELLRSPLIALQNANLKFVYHNHDQEFAMDDGVVLLDYLANNRCDNFGLLLDCYWAAYAGADPITTMRKYSAIIECLHLKDMTASREFAEVFEGIMDYQAIINAANQLGIVWAAVEQDVCKGDPFDSLKVSYQNIIKG